MKALKAGEQPKRGNPNDPNNTGEREIPKPKPDPLEPMSNDKIDFYGAKEFPPSDEEEEKKNGGTLPPIK